MTARDWLRVSELVNRIIAPVGLMIWLTVDIDFEQPDFMRIVGVKIGRRNAFCVWSNALWGLGNG